MGRSAGHRALSPPPEVALLLGPAATEKGHRSQMVQEKIADSYDAIRMLRLLVLETAWKIDQTSTQ